MVSEIWHGKRHYLWHAADQDDNVRDILVQSRRNKHDEEVLPQSAQRVSVRPARHHYRQVEELQCGEAGDPARDGASPMLIPRLDAVSVDETW